MKKTSKHDMTPLVDAYQFATVGGDFNAAKGLKLGLENIRMEIQNGFVVQLETIPVNAEPWVEQTFLNVKDFDLWVSQRFPLMVESEE